MTLSGWREVVRLVIERHPKECIFDPDALNNIMTVLEPHLSNDAILTENLVLIIEKAIMDQEIYCPHEGIDRR
jgi:hypothetical protein